MKNSWKKLFRSRRSVWFVLYAFAAPSMLALGGASIDYYRLHMVKTRLIHAADGAALAASGARGTEQQQEIATRYVKSIFPDNYMGSEGVTIEIKTDEQRGSAPQTVEVHLSTTMPMHYISMGGLIEGFDEVPVSWVSRSAWGIDSIEVILVIDYSGSMGTNDGCGGSSVPCTRLQAVKDVAAEFISLLLPNNSDTDDGGVRRSVGVVPFADFVAFDPRQLDILLRLGRSGASDALISQHSYGVRAPRADPNRPCLANRLRRGPQFFQRPSPYTYNFNNLFDINDALPSADDPQTWFYAHNFYMTYAYENSPVCDLRVSSNPEGGIPGEVEPGNYAFSATTLRRAYAVPLTSNRTVLLNAVNALDADGGTVIVDGLKWALRLLSPDWRGVWLAPETGLLQTDLPGISSAWTGTGDNTGVGVVHKYIVLLTDGLQSLPRQSSYGFEQYRRCPNFRGLLIRSPLFSVDYYNSGLERFCLNFTQWGYHLFRGTLHKDNANQDIETRPIPSSSSGSVVNYFYAPQGAHNIHAEVRERMVL